MTLVPIAETGGRFRDFGPYVASVNDRGVVAFQATLTDGGTGVYTGEGGRVSDVLDGRERLDVHSHPDINGAGECCFYARGPTGEDGVYHVAGAGAVRIAAPSGPLGPTMNEAGTVAFRAEHESGVLGVYVARAGAVVRIADSTEGFAGFQGLPVVNARGRVVFRADLREGRQSILIGDGASRSVIAETGSDFVELGNFPVLNDADDVVFRATLASGVSGIFVASRGRIECVVDSTGPFESLRGAVMNSEGRMVFYGTPRGGGLGVFSGRDPAKDGVIAIGAPLMGSTVADMAMNPVSMNERGQLAVRVRLEDGRGWVLRADPSE